MATTTIGASGVTFPDSSVQASAGSTNINTITVGTSPGTWTKNVGLKSIKVTVIGGGGNGGNGVSGSPTLVTYGGGGGGAGTAIRYYPAASLPGPQPYTVAGATGTSSFGVAPIAVITASGGSNGASLPTQAKNNGGSGGSGSNGQLNFKGSGGGFGVGGPAVDQIESGHGGSSFMGGGASGVVYPSTGTPAGGYGAGGSGGGAAAPSGGGGGSGSGGVVIIEEFY